MIISILKELLLRYAEGPLYSQEFTALLGVPADRVQALSQRLQMEDAHPQSDDLLGVQNLRWVLFQPAVDADSNDDDRGAADHALMLSFVFEGDLDDTLEELVRVPSTSAILSRCLDFDGENVIRYLKKRQVKSGYMFREPGPVSDSVGGPPTAYRWDPTRTETERAFDVQRRFEEFYDAQSRSRERRTESLRERFLAEFARDEFPFPLTKFERFAPDENRATRRLSEVIRRRQARVARNLDGQRRRGAHAKGHGFLRGSLVVERDVPDRYAKGIFSARGASYPLVARTSNGSPDVQKDGVRDARGLAFSVRLPEGGAPRFDEGAFLLPAPPEGRRQDFLLFNDPQFFATDIGEATSIFGIMSLSSNLQKLTHLLAYVLGAGAFKQAWLGMRALLNRALHPLEPTFHSGAPFLLGDDCIVKYSVELLRRPKGRPADTSRDDFLTEALQQSLATDSLVLALYAHAIDVADWGSSLKKLVDAVEDATTDFGVFSPRKVHMATLRFEPQDPAEPGVVEEGERWTFNPWNGLRDHRPLGSINRGRLRIQTDSVAYRTANPLRLVTTPPAAVWEASNSTRAGQSAAE